MVVERSGRGAETLVLLHAGVTDRRGWRSLARSLQDVAQVISYDRRGFGDSPKSDRVFTHLDDLQRVLDEFELVRAWLVGSGVDAWSRLHEVVAPTTVTWGNLDVPFIVERSRALQERLPSASSRAIADSAHLPYLERPDAVAQLVNEALLAHR